MTFSFYKYQGTGNDFILADDADRQFPLQDTALVARLCDRKFGIGADGLILLHPSDKADFRMVYFNADGREGSLCGNGGRCAVAFARFLNRIGSSTVFEASDGLHEARIEKDQVHLKMHPVHEIEAFDADYVLDTGSPHYVSFHRPVDSTGFVDQARSIRQSTPFRNDGINVNFVEEQETHHLRMRTFERGVEDETLSCGTGVTAAALAAAHKAGSHGKQHYRITTEGGDLEVTFEYTSSGMTDIWLIGPATRVFKGEVEL